MTARNTRSASAQSALPYTIRSATRWPFRCRYRASDFSNRQALIADRLIATKTALENAYESPPPPDIRAAVSTHRHARMRTNKGGCRGQDRIRGVMFEENLKNSMGLEFYNLSHRFGYQSPNWPYFEDVKIERIHYMAKSGVLSQRITTSMHNTTHIDAPAHVVQGTPLHRRGAAAAFLRLGHRGIAAEKQVGADHRR